MAASEHTPHYSLSQFGPDDRPSWIDDYNKDMRIIDTALTQGGSQGEPLFCTAKTGYGFDFTTSVLSPYRCGFYMSDGSIELDYDTYTIPITKSGYYAVSGVAEVYDVTLDADADADENDTLLLWIGKYSEEGDYETRITPDFFFNRNYETKEIPNFDINKVQSCSITPIIVHLDAGDAVTMNIGTYTSATLHGHLLEVCLTLESKMFDDDAD